MKALVVEDDFISRTMLQEILAPYGTCHVAANGHECMAAFQQALGRGEPYDLICLDIMMPEMDGQTALKELRQMEQTSGIGGSNLAKVIMVTALSDAKNIMHSFMKGTCQAYLTKPVNADELIEKCRELGLIDVQG